VSLKIIHPTMDAIHVESTLELTTYQTQINIGEAIQEKSKLGVLAAWLVERDRMEVI
jgi:hypothetical protein